MAWEENAGAPFTDTDRVSGLAFGFNTHPDTTNTGVIWVDDLSLGLAEDVAAATTETAPPVVAEEEANEPATPSANAAVPCPASLIALGLIGAPLAFHVKKRSEPTCLLGLSPGHPVSGRLKTDLPQSTLPT